MKGARRAKSLKSVKGQIQPSVNIRYDCPVYSVSYIVPTMSPIIFPVFSKSRRSHSVMLRKINVANFSQIFRPHIFGDLVNKCFFGSFIDLILDKVKQNFTVPKLFPLVNNFREKRQIFEK